MNTQTANRFQRGKNIKGAILAVLITALVTAVVFVAWGLISPLGSRPADGNIQTSWSTDSVQSGETVELSIDIEPELDIDTVMTLVTFNPKQLKYQSVSYDNTAFPTQIPAIVSDDSVRVQMAIMGGETVDEQSHVAIVTFEAVSDHRPAATIRGGSAHAGEARNPMINGAVVAEEDEDQGPLLWRWAYSAIIGLGVVVVGGTVGLIINRWRKGRIQK